MLFSDQASTVKEWRELQYFSQYTNDYSYMVRLVERQ
jgi:hypothetical protein